MVLLTEVTCPPQESTPPSDRQQSANILYSLSKGRGGCMGGVGVGVGGMELRFCSGGLFSLVQYNIIDASLFLKKTRAIFRTIY